MVPILKKGHGGKLGFLQVRKLVNVKFLGFKKNLEDLRRCKIEF